MKRKLICNLSITRCKLTKFDLINIIDRKASSHTLSAYDIMHQNFEHINYIRFIINI